MQLGCIISSFQGLLPANVATKYLLILSATMSRTYNNKYLSHNMIRLQSSGISLVNDTTSFTNALISILKLEFQVKFLQLPHTVT